MILNEAQGNRIIDLLGYIHRAISTTSGGGGGNVAVVSSTPQLNLESTQTQILNQVQSKIDRVKGSANYNRTLNYFNSAVPGSNITSIVHTGTTALGIETITETFTYVDVTQIGSNVTNIQYS
jgi:hypothetical protein